MEDVPGDLPVDDFGEFAPPLHDKPLELQISQGLPDDRLADIIHLANLGMTGQLVFVTPNDLSDLILDQAFQLRIVGD